MSQEEIEKIGNEQIGLIRGIDVVQMSHCKGHFFHAECLTHQLGDKAFIKCAICSHQYGKETGNMPNGTMTIYLNNSILPGHEKDSNGTWTVHYSISGGRNEKG